MRNEIINMLLDGANYKELKIFCIEKINENENNRELLYSIFNDIFNRNNLSLDVENVVSDILDSLSGWCHKDCAI